MLTEPEDSWVRDKGHDCLQQSTMFALVAPVPKEPWGQWRWTYLDAHTKQRVVMQEGNSELGRFTALIVSRSIQLLGGGVPTPSGLLNTHWTQRNLPGKAIRALNSWHTQKKHEGTCRAHRGCPLPTQCSVKGQHWRTGYCKEKGNTESAWHSIWITTYKHEIISPPLTPLFPSGCWPTPSTY